MKKDQENFKKMDLYEYEEKYVSKQNYKSAKTIIHLVVGALGILVCGVLLDVVYKAFQIHQYVGYGASVVAVLVLIFFYIVPISKIFRMKSFEIDVTRYNVKKAKKHNVLMRKELAEKFVDYNKNVANGSWYSSKRVDALEIALASKQDLLIREALTDIYNTDVKASSRNLIFNNAKDAFLSSALSQNATLDTLLVAVVNLRMIKDLVFMFGFRPTYPQLLKIYGKVMTNALITLGVGNVNVGTSISNAIGGFVKGIPLLGNAIASLIDSATQGLANGILTIVIGFQARKILEKEYKLQDILEGVDLGTHDADIAKMTKELTSFAKADLEKKKNGKEENSQKVKDEEKVATTKTKSNKQ